MQELAESGDMLWNAYLRQAIVLQFGNVRDRKLQHGSLFPLVNVFV